MMSKAIRYDRAGGPEVMKWVDVEVGEPGEGEIRVRQSACGLNYIDVSAPGCIRSRCRRDSAWKRQARWWPSARA
jgi:Zn-dependent alcohol dehydrogenase